MVDGALSLKAADKRLHEGLEAWQNLLENVRGHLAFVQQLAFANGVARFHDMLLLCLGCLANSQKSLISHNFAWVNLERQSNYEDAALFFWFREKRGSQAEVDYLLSVDGTIIPLAVKAGKTGRLRSLKQFMEEYAPPLAVRISQAPLSLDEHVLSVPLYALGQLPTLIRAAAAIR